MSHRLKQTTVLAAAAATLHTGCLKLDFMFLPAVPLDEYILPDNHIPDHQLEEVFFYTSQDETIYGVWAFNEDAPATILYCHGNNANLDEYWDRVQLFWDEGYNVFVFDYPGYGKSTGEPTESGVYRASEESLRHVVSRLNTNPVEPDSAASLGIVYYGWSLGSAAAIYLAAEVEEPAVLFTEAAMAGTEALVEDSTTIALPASFIVTMELDSIGRIPEVTAPKVFMHGEQDDYIAPIFSEMLFEASVPPHDLWLSEDAAHGNVVCDGATDHCEDAPEDSYDVWRDWINDTIAATMPE
jgi:pimeloyl-ACP methyl ester carboxylesterase